MMSMLHHLGKRGVKQDIRKAFELMQKAAELGLSSAHYTLGMMYSQGLGVEKNKEKGIHHYRLAAIGGDLYARYNLGVYAFKAENPQLAVKHWTIAAEAGYDKALDQIKVGYKSGYVTKDDFAKALRAHKEASDEMKSIQREKAKKNQPNESYSYYF